MELLKKNFEFQTSKIHSNVINSVKKYFDEEQTNTNVLSNENIIYRDFRKTRICYLFLKLTYLTKCLKIINFIYFHLECPNLHKSGYKVSSY